MKSGKQIIIDKNGIITIQRMNGQDVSINIQDIEDINQKLRLLDNASLDAMSEVIDKEKGEFNKTFASILSKRMVEKKYCQREYITD